MVTHNYTLADLAALPFAFVSLGIVCLIPGLFFCWLGDLLDFRRRRPLMQLLLGISVGIAASPILVYLLWRYFSFWGVCTIYLAGGVFAIFFVKGGRIRPANPYPPLPRPALLYVFGAIALWIFLAAASLVDLDFGDRLYPPLVIHDYGLRSFFISSISLTGVPPVNPLFDPGTPSPLRYHYFWYMLCGLAERFGGSLVDSRLSQIAGTIWSGIGLICALVLSLRVFPEDRRLNHGWRSLAGIGLLCVTGLDILPVGLITLFTGSLVGSLEWWNSPVMAWVHAALWVPHHLVALEICVAGFLVLWCASRSGRSGTRWVSVLVAGAAFASGAGTSVYVTFVFAGFVGVWTIICFVRCWYNEGCLLAAAGLTAAVLGAPYLADLAAGASGAASSGVGFIEVAVRPFTLVDILLLDVSDKWQQIAPFVRLISLPINYAFELGFFAIVGAYWRKTRKVAKQPLSRPDLCLGVMVACGLLIPGVLRSSVISNNDLGWRGPLVAQFALVMIGIEIVALWNSPYLRNTAKESSDVRIGDQRLLAALLMIGLTGSIYEVVVQRIYPILSDRGNVHMLGWLSDDGRLGNRTLALRAAYEALKTQSPRSATVQNNPKSYHSEIFAGLYAERKAACAISSCGTVFGGDAELAQRVEPDVRAIFDSAPPLDWTVVTRTCERFSIDLLVVSDQDGAWGERESWVWRQTPLVDRGIVRVFDCAGGAADASWNTKSIN